MANGTKGYGYQSSTRRVANDSQELLIPRLSETDVIDCSSTKWILVIEKEVCDTHRYLSPCLIEYMQAVFRSVVASTWWDHVSKHSIVLTVLATPTRKDISG